MGFISSERLQAAFNNISIGSYSLSRLTGSGNDNIAIGLRSMEGVQSGSFNIAIGEEPNQVMQSGDNNIALGNRALQIAAGNDNIAIGNCAGPRGNASCNISIGANTSSSSGLQGTIVIGYNAMRSLNSTGSDSVVVGSQASSCISNITGIVAVGTRSMQCNDGVTSVALGSEAGGVGSGSTPLPTNGGTNVYVGYRARVSSAAANGEFVLGNSALNTIITPPGVGISFLSDERDKKDIEDIPAGLAFIRELRPVKFVWNMRDGGKVNTNEVGFIAQELLEISSKYNANSWLHLADDINQEHLSASPNKLLPVMVKAIQEFVVEHDSKVSNLQSEIEELKKKYV